MQHCVWTLCGPVNPSPWHLSGNPRTNFERRQPSWNEWEIWRFYLASRRRGACMWACMCVCVSVCARQLEVLKISLSLGQSDDVLAKWKVGRDCFWGPCDKVKNRAGVKREGKLMTRSIKPTILRQWVPQRKCHSRLKLDKARYRLYTLFFIFFILFSEASWKDLHI